MTILDCEQGTREWVEARLGIPTASQFSRLLTPKRMQVSASRHRYRAELLAEWITGEPVDEFETEWTERGKAMEPLARSHYGIVWDVEPRQVGLCVRSAGSVFTHASDALCKAVPVHIPPDEHVVGASPDALVGDDGLLELKCPGMVNHIMSCADGGVPSAYKMQVQGQLWVTGRKWADFMSFYPDAPEQLLVRVEPDPAVQDAFDEVIPVFVAELAEARQNLIERGWKPWAEKQAEHERIMAEHDREEATRG